MIAMLALSVALVSAAEKKSFHVAMARCGVPEMLREHQPAGQQTAYIRKPRKIIGLKQGVQEPGRSCIKTWAAEHGFDVMEIFD